MFTRLEERLEVTSQALEVTSQEPRPLLLIHSQAPQASQVTTQITQDTLFTCVKCNKKYTRKAWYNKHILNCNA